MTYYSQNPEKLLAAVRQGATNNVGASINPEAARAAIDSGLQVGEIVKSQIGTLRYEGDNTMALIQDGEVIKTVSGIEIMDTALGFKATQMGKAAVPASF